MNASPVSRPLRRLLVVAAALAALAAPASASAACPTPSTSTPFAQWIDLSSYFLAPNGGFEGGTTSWTLAGGARVATGNEPWKVRGGADSHLLVLPLATTATATSSLFCTNVTTPSFRFFVRSDGIGLGLNWLQVDAMYYSTTTGAYLGTQSSIALIPPQNGIWTPTLGIGLRPYFTDSYAKLVFTAHGTGGGTYSIDDVFIDPWHCC